MGIYNVGDKKRKTVPFYVDGHEYKLVKPDDKNIILVKKAKPKEGLEGVESWRIKGYYPASPEGVCTLLVMMVWKHLSIDGMRSLDEQIKAITQQTKSFQDDVLKQAAALINVLDQTE